MKGIYCQDSPCTCGFRYFHLDIDTVGQVLIASINFELRVFPTFAINRFANKNYAISYIVRGRHSQFLDSYFGRTCLQRNH